MRLVAAALFSYVYSYAYVNVYICSGRIILPNQYKFELLVRPIWSEVIVKIMVAAALCTAMGTAMCRGDYTAQPTAWTKEV